MVLPDTHCYSTSPQALLQLMKDLERSGFHPAFTFNEGQLTMIIQRKPVAKKLAQDDSNQQQFY
ncbi:MAG: hypothetical protein NWE83_10650 [Candidatus Bathyarchaeota archaeon]|nr:hypothetical protein [Candidatus Bathyarchaeota archaeon]